MPQKYFDGKETLSEVKSALVQNGKINIYPNPGKDVFTVDFSFGVVFSEILILIFYGSYYIKRSIKSSILIIK
ncbi:MAG: hypothetical protein K2X86_15805 [Cytophagaceae bacterium]|nr:hypothetical protein [Cytophagaceae bacterium]